MVVGNVLRNLVNKTNRCTEFQPYWYYYSTLLLYNITIFVIVIYVTAKPTVIRVVIFRSLKECVHSVHVT